MKFKSLDDLQQILPGAAQPPRPADPSGHDGKGKPVRLLLDTKGRKGKSVTLVTGLRHNPDTLKDLARLLKEFCGTGGTVKDGVIELQGDQRERAAVKLKSFNYRVS